MNLDHFFKELTGIDNATSNPLPVLKWMRENMSTEYSDYLDWVFSLPLSQRDIVDYVNDLSNLAQFLIEHPEWGEIGCPDHPECPDRDNCYGPCNNILPKKVHPALAYALSHERDTNDVESHEKENMRRKEVSHDNGKS